MVARRGLETPFLRVWAYCWVIAMLATLALPRYVIGAFRS